MLRYDFLNVTGSDSQNTLKVHYEQFYVKYKGSNRGYINYDFQSFSDLELSFWFELRYLKVRLWALVRDQTLTHLSIDISVIPKYILNHNISLES